MGGVRITSTTAGKQVSEAVTHVGERVVRHQLVDAKHAFGSGWTSGEPAGRGHGLHASNRRAVSGSRSSRLSLGYVLRARPQLALRDALGFARSAVVGSARDRKMIVTFWRRTAKFLAPHQSGLSSLAGMIDRLLETVRLQRNFRQKCLEPARSHGAHKSRNKALDEHESFADGKLLYVMHEVPDRRIVQPLIEGTVPCIDVAR